MYIQIHAHRVELSYDDLGVWDSSSITIGNQEGNKLMFLSEWREFPSAPCLEEKKNNDSSRLDVVEIARVPEMLPRLFPSWSG